MHRLLLSFLLLLPLPAAAASPQEIQIENSRAVVYLEIEDESGNFVENGTGFVVSHDGYVVTVAHLKVDPTQKMWAIVGAREGTRYPLAFRDSDERADVALWQLPQSATCRLSVIFGTAPVQVLDRILILGFPGKEGLTVAQVSVENTTSSLGLYKVDGFLRPGFSGGPALNEAGQVVALVQGGTLPGTENNDLVPIAPAIDLINRRGVRASINEPAPYDDHCYSSCKDETHGVEGWGVEEPWRNETGWIDGGSGQDDQCALLKAATLAGRPGAEIQVTRKWEESRKDLLGHVTYKYFCEGILRANPVYFEKRSSACGLWN